MKLFQQLLVAPAALGLLAPMAATAAELNLQGVNQYTSEEQVTSISQFSDVQPTSWAYQALSNLIERYGCVAGYPNGTFKGGQALTRWEAAALLNACLDRITEITDELKKLMEEFEKELAVLRGRVDGLEAKVGELEANQFSTTTKLNGKATFVIGANSYSGDATSGGYTDIGEFEDDVNDATAITGPTAQGRLEDALRSSKGARNALKSIALAAYTGGNVLPSDNLADRARALQGATSFNYDVKLNFDTSFTGKDLFRTQLRAGNFKDSPFGGPVVGLNALEAGFEENCGSGVDCGDVVAINRLFYQFPIGKSFTATIGGRVRQDDMLAMWPSAYPADTVLDVFTYAGAPGTYSLNLGAGGGLWWKSGGFSLSANYVSANGDVGNPSQGGIGTTGSASTGTGQIAYAGTNWGIAAAYTYTQGAAGIYGGNATPLAVTFNQLADSSNSVGISAYWQPATASWFPGISVGWGLSGYQSDAFKIVDQANTQSWYVGLQWMDVFWKGNAFGMAVGQPTFLTKSGDEGILESNDGNYAWEWWYKFQVTDNISVTPALFYLSAPLGQLQKSNNDSFNNFGGLVKTTFKF